jgi:hypothetical protein
VNVQNESGILGQTIRVLIRFPRAGKTGAAAGCSEHS